MEGIFQIRDAPSPYPIVYQHAGAALITDYPGANRSAAV